MRKYEGRGRIARLAVVGSARSATGCDDFGDTPVAGLRSATSPRLVASKTKPGKNRLTYSNCGENYRIGGR